MPEEVTCPACIEVLYPSAFTEGVGVLRARFGDPGREYAQDALRLVVWGPWSAGRGFATLGLGGTDTAVAVQVRLCPDAAHPDSALPPQTWWVQWADDGTRLPPVRDLGESIAYALAWLTEHGCAVPFPLPS